MAAVAIGVAGTTLYVLYRAAFEQQRERLVETAQSQARLMEAVARFDAQHSEDVPGGGYEATLFQIREAHEQFKGFGETGEFTLAELEGDQIVFLLSHRHFDLDNPEPVPFEGEVAEPMRRALSGESGTVVGLDYRGELVLAAYEPVQGLDLGIVAKIDVAEVRAPFIKAGIIAVVTASAIVLVGAFLFLRVTEPLLRTLEQSETNLKKAQELAHLGSYEMNVPSSSGDVWSEETFRIVGLDPSEGELLADEFIQQAVHEEDRGPVSDAIRQAIENAVPFDFEYRVVRPNGSVRHVQSAGEPVHDQSGQVVKLVGTLLDITEHKQAENLLLTERTRISMELHDSVIQSLYAIGLELDVLLSQESIPAGDLKPAVDSLSRVIDDIRQFILDLSRIDRQPTTFHRCLERDILPRLHIPESTSIEVDVPDAPLLLSQSTMDGVCQMIREAISNALRHADASQIKIIGRQMTELFQVTIVDDGQGFDLNAISDRPGMGLRNLRKRAQIHGGQLLVDSTPGRGTKITISIPT
jgi:PAS domain S-box-containing protein